MEIFSKRKKMLNNYSDSSKTPKSFEMTLKNKKIDKLVNDKSINVKSEINAEKINFNFCNYIYYLLCCHKNKTINYYNDFRQEIISEESMIKNHFDLLRIKTTINEKFNVINNV